MSKLDDEKLERQEIVTFSTKAPEVSNPPPAANSNAKYYHSSIDRGPDYTIKSFLQRPRVVAKYNWIAGIPQGNDIGAFDIPQCVFNSQTNIDKVNNMRYISFTTCFRVVVNVNKFCLGRLLIYWEPFNALRGDYNITAGLNITSNSGYDHVTLDANSSSVALFKVPFIFPQSRWDMLYDTNVPWATVHLNVLNFLNGTSGIDTANITVYAHCEDIELDVPTMNTFTPLPNFASSGLKSSSRMFNAHMTENVIMAKNNTVVTPSVGSVAKGVIQTVTGLVDQDGPAATWLNLAEGALAAFGFSKPPNVQATQPVIQFPIKSYCSHNGNTGSVVLAAESQNAVSINAMGDSKEDDMAIQTVVSRPCILDTFPWHTSDPAGKVLFSIPVNPGFTGSHTAGTTQVRSTLSAFVSSQFELWRGSMKYKVDTVATIFHTGRLALAFLSGVYSVPGVLNPDTLEMLPRVIIDVQGSTEMTYTVPYNVAPPYMKVRVASANSTGVNFTIADLLQQDVSPGLLVCYVDNELKCPDTVSSLIPINLWVWCGDDMVFAVPTNPRYCAVPLPTPVPKKKSVPSPTRVFSAHMSDLNTVPSQLNVPVQDDSTKAVAFSPKSVEPRTDMLSAVCLGEAPIRNIRQLTRMMSISFGGTIPANNQMEIDPASFDGTSVTWIDTRANHFAHIYALWRGSNEYVLVPENLTNQYPGFFVYSFITESTTIDTPNMFGPPFTPKAIGFTQYYSTNNTPYLEFRLPYYTGSSISSVVTNSDGFQRPLVRIQSLSSLATSVVLLQSKGDDFSFYKVCGAPNMRLKS
jgi:hypothetical protein